MDKIIVAIVTSMAGKVGDNGGCGIPSEEEESKIREVASKRS